MTRSTMAAFDADRSAELTLVFKDATDVNPLGQVQSFSWTNSLESSDNYRVGDSSRYRDYTAENVDWEMTIYEDDDFSEVREFFPEAGITTTDSTFTLYVASYGGEAVASTRNFLETIAGAQVTNVTRGVEANSTNMWQFSGTGTNVTATTATA